MTDKIEAKEQPLILVADDSQIARKIIIKMLKKKNYNFIEAESGSEVIEKIRVSKPNCIILDLLMPDVTGIDVLKYLKIISHKIPVIVLTANIQVPIKNECYELGAVGFLNKPPEENELIKIIEDVLN